MSEIGDVYKAIKEVDRQDRESNREAALSQFELAQELAERHGMIFVQRTESHYQLSRDGWLINVYPGNRRIYADRNKVRAPYLSVPDEWNLMDVIEAAVKAIGE